MDKKRIRVLSPAEVPPVVQTLYDQIHDVAVNTSPFTLETTNEEEETKESEPISPRFINRVQEMKSKSQKDLRIKQQSHKFFQGSPLNDRLLMTPNLSIYEKLKLMQSM